MDVWCKAYPALSFSFISVIPSLDTSLLKTRIPITMLTCRREKTELKQHAASSSHQHAALLRPLRPMTTWAMRSRLKKIPEGWFIWCCDSGEDHRPDRHLNPCNPSCHGYLPCYSSCHWSDCVATAQKLKMPNTFCELKRETGGGWRGGGWDVETEGERGGGEGAEGVRQSDRERRRGQKRQTVREREHKRHKRFLL